MPRKTPNIGFSKNGFTILEGGPRNKNGSIYYLVEHKCGHRFRTLFNSLKNRIIKTCHGCTHSRKEGVKKNNWLILKCLFCDNGNTNVLAKCSCGTIKIVSLINILEGTSKSCGHEYRYKHNPHENILYKRAKFFAKQRKISFKLSFKLFSSTIRQDCHYCFNKGSNLLKHKATNTMKKFCGIDRKDSNKGYIKNNIVPCCAICNRAKLDLPYEIFQLWLESIRHNANIK